MSHTPGSWIADDDYCVWHPEEKADRQPFEQIAVVESRNPDWPANQRLIAAAPDLLEAVEKLLTLFPGHDEARRLSEKYGLGSLSADIIDTARAVIAKARGES